MTPDLADTVARWQSWLADERRCSPRTLAAYGSDLAAFLDFLAGLLRIGFSFSIAETRRRRAQVNRDLGDLAGELEWYIVIAIDRRAGVLADVDPLVVE
jgi:hypothetical protein